MKKTFITLCFGLILGACASTGNSGSGDGSAPDWVRDKDSAYPPDKYLAELGEGDSLKGAKAEAAGAIAQIFRSQITVESTLRTRYTEITGETGNLLGLQTQTDFDQSIGQNADETLSNMKYGESWQDDMGRVYTVAYLDRLETGNLYRQRIIEIDQRVVELLQRAEAQDESLKRYAFLDAALVVSESSEVLLEQLEIINMPMARSVKHPYVPGDIRASKADQAAALNIVVEVVGDDEGIITATLSEWVSSKGFSLSASGDMFLAAFVDLAAVELDNGYENLRWSLSISLLDSRGYEALSLSEQNRSSGVSESAALSRAYRDMKDMIRKELDKAFTAYLNSFLEK